MGSISVGVLGLVVFTLAMVLIQVIARVLGGLRALWWVWVAHVKIVPGSTRRKRISRRGPANVALCLDDGPYHLIDHSRKISSDPIFVLFPLRHVHSRRPLA